MRFLVSLSFSAISCTCGLSARTGTTSGKWAGRATVSLLGIGLVPLPLNPIIATATRTSPRRNPSFLTSTHSIYSMIGNQSATKAAILMAGEIRWLQMGNPADSYLQLASSRTKDSRRAGDDPVR